MIKKEIDILEVAKSIGLDSGRMLEFIAKGVVAIPHKQTYIMRDNLSPRVSTPSAR